MPLISGDSGSYRPTDGHIGRERLSKTLKVVNRKQNKNKTITEGLELFAIREVGSVEEKLDAMAISYKELITYMNSIQINANNSGDRRTSTTVVDEKSYSNNDDIKIIDKSTATETEIVTSSNDKNVAYGMITTMTRNE